MIDSTPTIKTVQPILENIWWVIPNKLAGVRKPTEEEISELQKKGIGAIISVMDDPSNIDLYEKIGLPHLWSPTKGGTAPSREQIQELQVFIEKQNGLGKAVAVHCTSGRRRTGTILAAYLVQKGLSYAAAMKTVLSSNPDVELRESQIAFLKELSEEKMADD